MAASDKNPIRWYDWVPVAGAVDITIRRKEFRNYLSQTGHEFGDFTSPSQWNGLAWYQSICTASAVMYPLI